MAGAMGQGIHKVGAGVGFFFVKGGQAGAAGVLYPDLKGVHREHFGALGQIAHQLARSYKEAAQAFPVRGKFRGKADRGVELLNYLLDRADIIIP